MIKLKSKEELEIMKEGGRRLRKVVMELIPTIKAGMTTNQIDLKAEELIRIEGGEPSFKKVKNYHWSTCITINEQIVHTPPSEKVVREGDLLTVDIGMYYQGFHTDYSDTLAIGKVDENKKKFLETGKKTLNSAIKIVKPGARLGEVSRVIQQGVEGAGYAIIKELTGHGVGKDLHEDPFIPGYVEIPVDKTYKIKSGLVVAVEVIYAMGEGAMAYEKGNEWSIVTADGSLSACFEHTVAVNETGSIILT